MLKPKVRAATYADIEALPLPDWVCEVLSPSTRALDRTDKLDVYAEFSVGHCWCIEPEGRTLEVLELVAGAGAVSAPEAQAKSPGAVSAPAAPWKYLIAATFRDADAVAAPPFAAHTFRLDVPWVADVPAPEQGSP